MEELAHGAQAIRRPKIALRVAALLRDDDADAMRPAKVVVTFGGPDPNHTVEGEIEPV
jgi:hypothetical protein